MGIRVQLSVTLLTVVGMVKLEPNKHLMQTIKHAHGMDTAVHGGHTEVVFNSNLRPPVRPVAKKCRYPT